MHLLGFTSDNSDVNDISSGQDNDIDVSMMCCCTGQSELWGDSRIAPDVSRVIVGIPQCPPKWR